MSHREHFIAGIRMQRDLLNYLILELETKENFDFMSRNRYEHTAKEVEKNLKKIEKDCSRRKNKRNQNKSG